MFTRNYLKKPLLEPLKHFRCICWGHRDEARVSDNRQWLPVFEKCQNTKRKSSFQERRGRLRLIETYFRVDMHCNEMICSLN